MSQASLASALWPARSADPAEARRAREAVERLCALERLHKKCPTPQSARELCQAGHELCDPLDPVALASQYAFAISSLSGLSAAIVPRAFWSSERELASSSPPIARLLPYGSRDFSFESDWSVAGYPNVSQALDLAQELMSRGFVWDLDFQDFYDYEWSLEPVAPLLYPIVEARALELAVPAPARSRPAPRV